MAVPKTLSWAQVLEIRRLPREERNKRIKEIIKGKTNQ